jgi:hypothetical protein
VRVFKDKKGREWRIDLNVGVLKRLKASGYDLLAEIKGSGERKVFEDAMLLPEVVWLIVGNQTQHNEADFLESLGGDELEKMAEALVEAVLDFFPQGQRERMRRLLAKGKEVQTVKLDQAEAKVISKLEAEISGG